MGQRIEKPNFVRNEAMQIFGLNFIFYATRESPRGGVVFSLGVVRYKMDLKIEFCGFKKIFRGSSQNFVPACVASEMH